MKKTVYIIIGILLVLPVLYLVVALLFSVIPTGKSYEGDGGKVLYLKSNGVHTDLIIPNKYLDRLKRKGVKICGAYTAIGWGDRGFYLNTPEWKDLKFSIAFQAAFLKSETLMHITPYEKVASSWKQLRLSETQLSLLLDNIEKQFDLKEGRVQLIPNASYGNKDTFYKAYGYYHLFNTCNTWTNSQLKKVKLKSSLWTPFDFGVMRWYE